jgi:hypothetical protein
MKNKLTKYSALAIFLLFTALANINGQTPSPTPRRDPSKIFPLSLEIVRIEPVVPVENQPLRVYFKFSNDDIVRKNRTGFVTGEIKNGSGRRNAIKRWDIKDLQSGQSVEGFLTFNVPLNFRTGLIEISYYEITETTYNPIQKRDFETTKKLSTTTLDFSTLLDVDKDTIDDRVEQELLEKFRPYYKFSNDGGNENYRPTDVWWYITKSELLTVKDDIEKKFLSIENLQNPNAILIPNNYLYIGSDITQNTAPTNYHIKPKENVAGESESNSGRFGNSWDKVLVERNTGLYGHIVPVTLTDPYKFDFNYVLTGNDQGKIYYKVEYWQFFGYNDSKALFEIGDHEGDWTSVQLIYDPETKQIKSVFHFAHGILFKYDISPQNDARQIIFADTNGEIKEFQGLNYKHNSSPLDLSHLDLGNKSIEKNDEQIKLAQNNLVRFFKDPQTGEFTHPVVYIENGSHEFFPSELWRYYGSPNHNGKSYSYLTAKPPNLGEVENPLQETKSANIVLKFNGYWGTYGNHNDPPPGPSLHKNWTYPASSSIRWQMKWSLGF